jgi:hypothetical protein
MPRDQETSFRNDPTASDDPLFREPSDRFGDGQVPRDQDQGDRDLADPDDTGATPIGDELTGRHAASADADEVTPANGSASGPVTDTPGEWVAGAKGPDYTPGADTDTGTRVGADTGTRVGSDFDAPLGTDVRDGHDADTPVDTDTHVDTDTPVDTDPLVPAASASSPATGVTEVPADTEPASATGGPVASGTPFATEDSATAPAAPTDTPVTTEGATAVTDVPATTEAPVTTETPSAADVPATAGEPAAASATPATPVPGAPGTAETPGVNTTSFVTNGDELHADWARIQSSFVDDPRGSVSQAADLVSQVTGSLVAAVQQREQALRGEWESQEGTDTEHLRNALRDYRAYFELLVKL